MQIVHYNFSRYIKTVFRHCGCGHALLDYISCRIASDKRCRRTVDFACALSCVVSNAFWKEESLRFRQDLKIDCRTYFVRYFFPQISHGISASLCSKICKERFALDLKPLPHISHLQLNREWVRKIGDLYFYSNKILTFPLELHCAIVNAPKGVGTPCRIDGTNHDMLLFRQDRVSLI